MARPPGLRPPLQPQPVAPPGLLLRGLLELSAHHLQPARPAGLRPCQVGEAWPSAPLEVCPRGALLLPPQARLGELPQAQAGQCRTLAAGQAEAAFRQLEALRPPWAQPWGRAWPPFGQIPPCYATQW